MSLEDPYCRAEAFLEDDGQIDWMGDGVLCQPVTVLIGDDIGALEPVACSLTAQEARTLAFQLLVCAEHAERRCRHRPEDNQP